MLRIYRALPFALLPGCLVSFNDYPLGEIEGRAGAAPNAGDGGTSNVATGGVAPLGGSDAPPSAGSQSVSYGGDGIVSTPPGNLLDDFEEKDSQILPREGRQGFWYVGNDGKAMQTPSARQPVLPEAPQPPRAGSNGALHTFGGPFPVWGALVGTSLTIGDYDLSRYSGIRMWVRRGSLPGAIDSVRVSFPMPGTNDGPEATCTSCSDHFGVSVPLGTEWARVDVKLSDLKQSGWGVPQLEAPDLKRVTSLQFAFPQDVAFDVWIDDIEFY